MTNQEGKPTNFRKCIRCGHEWYIRSANNPKVCPKCVTTYWNEEEVPKEKIIHCSVCGAAHDIRKLPGGIVEGHFVPWCHTCGNVFDEEEGIECECEGVCPYGHADCKFLNEMTKGGC